MRLILDECIPKKFKASFVGHECSTIPEEGLAGKQNGELLSFVEQAGFQVFVTLDKGIRYQQNLDRPKHRNPHHPYAFKSPDRPSSPRRRMSRGLKRGACW